MADQPHLTPPRQSTADPRCGCEFAEIFDLTTSGDDVLQRERYSLRLTELIEAGKLTVDIAETYALKDTDRAWEDSMGGHTRGKIVITVD